MRGIEPRILVGTEGGLRSFGAVEVPADALAGHTVTALPRRRLNGPVSIVSSRVDRKSIEKVAAAIAPYVRVTPIVELAGADFGLAPFPLVLKLELLQHSGSFNPSRSVAVHIAVAPDKPEPLIESVCCLPRRPRREFNGPSTKRKGTADSFLTQSFAHTTPSDRLVHYHVLDPSPYARRDPDDD